MLKCMISWDDSSVTEEEKLEFLEEVLVSYHHTISLHEDEVGEIKDTYFEITMEPNKVVQELPRRLDPIKHVEIDTEVQCLLWQGRIVPASGKWSSPIVAI